MISRQWRGLARPERAHDYVRHLRTETFPQLRWIAGWESLEAIRDFAGLDAETAVVPEEVQRMMLEYDRRVRHYQVVEQEIGL
jgi:hypothetical protein